MNIIETHDLCKQYGNALRVAHLDLDVPEGSVYGFLGPNGAGKSTTLKMILGLVRPTAGSIRVLGKSMDSKNRLAVLRQVGSLIESPSYYGHLTGEENLRIVQTLRGVPEKNIREVLQIVRLDGQRGKKVAHYSLGMKQRLGLAAALLGFPRLLILDEPTNGLDPAGIQEMRELICSLPERFGMTVVVSSHLLSEIDQMADHVAIIREGELVFQDTLEALHGRTPTTWPCGPPTTRWPGRFFRKNPCPARRKKGTSFSPSSPTSWPGSSPACWERAIWASSAWRSGRRVWRTSSWN